MMSKHSKPKRNPAPPTTRNTIAKKLAAMASPANRLSQEEGISMSQLVQELSKQRTSIKEDISSLIQQAVGPLHASVNALRETVDGFQTRLTDAETLAGDNFEKITEVEQVIQSLRKQNAALLDRIEDLENRSRRSNLRIINVPEGSEGDGDTVTFMSEMLMEITGGKVFNSAPTLDRAHRVGKKPTTADENPRTFLICFHRFQDKERLLHFATQNAMEYKDAAVRIYADYSNSLSQRRADFNSIKHSLYLRGIKFRLRYPAKLRVFFEGETLNFGTPEEAKAFYDRRVAPGILE